jgi:hypothetical protein
MGAIRGVGRVAGVAAGWRTVVLEYAGAAGRVRCYVTRNAVVDVRGASTFLR